MKAKTTSKPTSKSLNKNQTLLKKKPKTKNHNGKSKVIKTRENSVSSESNLMSSKVKKKTKKDKAIKKHNKVVPITNGWANETFEEESVLKSKKRNKKKKTNPVGKNEKKTGKQSNMNGLKKPKSADQLKIHREQIESLKDIDPEFYTFLKENDKQLLDFNWDDTDEDEDIGSDEESKTNKDSDDEKNEKVHVPQEKLEIASDESDFEESDDNEGEDNEQRDDKKKSSKTITIKILRAWQTELQSNKVPVEIIRNVTQAFSSALASISDQKSKVAVYKVEGASTFNAIIQLCVLHLQEAVHKFLGITEKTKTAIHKSKKWERVRSCLRYYFLDLTKLIEHVSSTHILAVLLKHLHQMSTMVASFQTISKPILKRLIVLWSTSEESVRVLSFLCILKIARNQQHILLNHVLKAMYMSYVRNSKFVSPNTLPGINFMRRSLVEMFALDLNTTYQHAFLYIRQLAIHLRNAIILKKKESFQAVYNWQYINSIRLWADLLGETINKPQLQPLIYPLVSITTGVIKLIPTAQFFPLRFHCIHALISLTRQTNTFIPVMPFILEVLNSNTFNKKHTIVSMKPMQFSCILRLNKSQMSENGFRDEVVENVCGLTLEFLAHESSSLAFPDLVVPAVMGLKQYLKVCKNANYSRKVKQLLDKILENSKFIENERKKITFGLKDTQLILAWESTVRDKGTPLGIYFASWLKTHQVKKKRQAANTDNINEYDIPMIKRKKPNEMKNKKHDEDDSDVELFPSDSEDDEMKFNEDDDVDNQDVVKENPEIVKKVKKQKVKHVKKHIIEDEDDFNDDQVDIVKDLDLDDW